MAVSAHSHLHERVRALSNEAVLRLFECETAHDSGATAATYRRRIGAALRRHQRAHDELLRLVDCIASPDRLAALFSTDRALLSGEQLQRATLTGLRVAVRAFIGWIPLAAGVDRSRLHGVLADAREAVSDHHGLRKVGRYGAPAAPFSPRVPSAGVIARVIDALRGGDVMSTLTADLVSICFGTGARVGSLLSVTGRDIARGTDGRVRLQLVEKARSSRRSVLLPRVRPGLADEWAALSPSASPWQRGRVLSYPVAKLRLRRACEAAGVTQFSFHDLRRAYATDAGGALGLARLQDAAGWRAARVAEGYYHPRIGR